ncbi:DUF2971 domain-containing protein [Fluviicola taffensis]|uniref:DUF2971 domain-containing protein n=1 Tax=Fluviicola taffensis (strain DSM 16823 / NCIMB 13979 / RW262) TaxID=755732 RepID=F2IGI2_FLUTR|nr:DUF2971 domain-containing protein [Fluviicola taffensis]AEA42588.1 hypothetical protein Fluta_0584 [Fluviicola taffensis DSM 16823]
MEKTYRLGKIAGELNLGISTIAEIIEFFGGEIDTNPNTKLTPEQVKCIKDNHLNYHSLKQQFETLKHIRSKKDTLPKVTTFAGLNAIRDELGEPKIIYKYFGDNNYTLDSLRNDYLYHSYYLDFNDPFDCSSYLIDINGNANRATREVFKETLKKSMEINGICCFSRINDSILMWSHYANKHRGICLEFENSNDAFQTKDVHYVKNFKKPDLFIDREDALYHMIYTKSEEWSYEKELRSFKKITYNNTEARKINFDFKMLKAIYFGVNAQVDFIKNVKEILSTKDTTCQLYFGRLKKNEFGIEWVKGK